MKYLSASEDELLPILAWERSFLSLTDDQKSLCVALHRNPGPMQENDLAVFLDCTVDELKQANVGIYGILVDASTREYWIK